MPSSPSDPPVSTSAPHVCLGCGCLCDDIVWPIDRSQPGLNACPKGNAWYQTPESTHPPASFRGKEVSLDEALVQARQILSASRHPLVTGFANATSEAQRAACGLADSWGAIFDPTASLLDADSTIAFQTTGAVTATWGEIAQRADTLLLWGEEPPVTSPRQFERYSWQPKSPWLPHGASDRQLIVVDDRANSATELAEFSLTITPGRHYEALGALRLAVNGMAADPKTVHSSMGVEWEVWQQLAERLQRARFGGLIYGKRVGSGWGENVGQLTKLLIDLQRHARWVGVAAGGPGNFTGAVQVATWQTGFPLGVRLAPGYPEYGPHEWLSATLLARDEVDAALIVGDNLLEALPPSAQQTLTKISTVVLHWHDSSTSDSATVRIRVARPVVEGGGTVYRPDGLALPVRPVQPTTAYPTAEEVLQQLTRDV